MTLEIQDFIVQNSIAVIAVVFVDGSSHAATVHYSHTNDPLTFFVSTGVDSKKCEPLKDGKVANASLVIGFSEKEMLTFQANGEVSVVSDPTELARIQHVHYKKHPSAEKFKNDPNTVFLKFRPTWWRFSDYNSSPPQIVTEA